MIFQKWILASVLALAGFNAAAANEAVALTESCISRIEMQEISSHFGQFRELADKGDYCFDGTQTAHLLAGIMFMRKTQFASSMPSSPDELFSGRFAHNWYDYFIGRINEFDVQESCPKGVGAYVYFFGNTMYVCPMLLSDNFTALDRASVFMHEARHIDGFPHTTCKSGPRQGLNGACDNRIGDGGSYAVTVETYAQIAAYGGDLHPALRAYSRSSAIVYADEAFDTPARIARTSQLLAMTQDKGFHALKIGANSVEAKVLGQSPALGHIVMRGQHMILYPDDKNLTAKYVFARNEGEIQQSAGDIASEYNSQSPQQRAELRDVHIGAQWTVKIYSSKAVFSCDPRSEASREISLNGEAAVSLIYPEGYDRAGRRIHLVTQSGRIFELGCEASKTPFLRQSNLTYDESFKRIQKVGTEVVGLTNDGRLFLINGSRSTLLATPLNGQIHEIAPNQSVDFFDK